MTTLKEISSLFLIKTLLQANLFRAIQLEFIQVDFLNFVLWMQSILKQVVSSSDVYYRRAFRSCLSAPLLIWIYFKFKSFSSVSLREWPRKLTPNNSVWIPFGKCQTAVGLSSIYLSSILLSIRLSFRLHTFEKISNFLETVNGRSLHHFVDRMHIIELGKKSHYQDESDSVRIELGKNGCSSRSLPSDRRDKRNSLTVRTIFEASSWSFNLNDSRWFIFWRLP